MTKFTSTKVFEGYSTVFRQWKADGTHCRFLHGYGVSFKVWFEGPLDGRNWVWDFGGMKRAKTLIDGKNPKEYFDWLLDHTVIVAQDDPYLKAFEIMDKEGIIQLRVLPAVGCEKFAEFLFNKISDFIHKETSGKVWVKQLEFRENHKNSAIVRR